MDSISDMAGAGADLKKSQRQKSNLDRLPPYAKDEEMCVIGSCLYEPQPRIAEAAQVIVTPEMFYELRCRTARQIIHGMELSEVNIISVLSRLAGKMDKHAAHSFLDECQELVPSPANLPIWLEDVQSKYTLRQIIATCTEAISESFTTKDAAALLDKASAIFCESGQCRLTKKTFAHCFKRRLQ